VSQAIETLKSLSPALLIVLGAILFFFSEAVKWVAKAAGAIMIVYGVVTLLGVVLPAPVENIENVVDNLLSGLACLG